MGKRFLSKFRRMTHLILGTALVFIAQGESWAEPQPSQSESLKTSAMGHGAEEHESLRMLSGYLTQAARQNAELESAFYRWKAALEKVPQETALPDPSFNFEYFLRSSAGARPDKYGLMQEFPWFGTLALKGEMASQEANSLKAEYDALKLKLFFEVKDAFYEHAYLAKAIEISREEVELLRYLEGVARARYTTGAIPYADVIRTQVQLGKAEDVLRTFVDMRRPVMARLAASLNLPRETLFPMPDAVPLMLISLTDEEIFFQLPQTNPAIRKYEYLGAKEKAGIDLAKKQYFPEFSLGIEYENTFEEAGPEGEPAFKPTEPLRAVFSIRIPFWWEKRQAAVREAQANRLATEKGNRATLQKLTSDIQLALYKYRDAQRKIELYRDTLIPRADQALKVTLEAFQAGAVGSLELIDSERTLLEFELNYVRALSDQAQKFAELEMLLGTEIPCEIHGTILPKQIGPGK